MSAAPGPGEKRPRPSTENVPTSTESEDPVKVDPVRVSAVTLVAIAMILACVSLIAAERFSWFHHDDGPESTTVLARHAHKKNHGDAATVSQETAIADTVKPPTQTPAQTSAKSQKWVVVQ